MAPPGAAGENGALHPSRRELLATRLAELAVTEVERFVAGEPALHRIRAEDLDRIA